MDSNEYPIWNFNFATIGYSKKNWQFFISKKQIKKSAFLLWVEFHYTSGGLKRMLMIVGSNFSASQLALTLCTLSNKWTLIPSHLAIAKYFIETPSFVKLLKIPTFTCHGGLDILQCRCPCKAPVFLDMLPHDNL